jgi:hypothetical protein
MIAIRAMDMLLMHWLLMMRIPMIRIRAMNMVLLTFYPQKLFTCNLMGRPILYLAVTRTIRHKPK